MVGTSDIPDRLLMTDPVFGCLAFLNRVVYHNPHSCWPIKERDDVIGLGLRTPARQHRRLGELAIASAGH